MTDVKIALEGVIENLQEALVAAQAAMADPSQAATSAEEIKSKIACVRFYLRAIR
jgi:hypothetical protein